MFLTALLIVSVICYFESKRGCTTDYSFSFYSKKIAYLLYKYGDCLSYREPRTLASILDHATELIFNKVCRNVGYERKGDV